MSLTSVGRKYAALMAIGKLFRSNGLSESLISLFSVESKWVKAL